MLVDPISKRSQKFQLGHFHIRAPESAIYVLSCQEGQESEAVIFRNKVVILKLLEIRALHKKEKIRYLPYSSFRQETTRHDTIRQKISCYRNPKDKENPKDEEIQRQRQTETKTKPRSYTFTSIPPRSLPSTCITSLLKKVWSSFNVWPQLMSRLAPSCRFSSPHVVLRPIDRTTVWEDIPQISTFTSIVAMLTPLTASLLTSSITN